MAYLDVRLEKARLLFLLLPLTGMLNSCAKQEEIDILDALQKSCASPPSPLRFVLVGKNGRNLVTSSANKLMISFSENGKPQYVPYTTGRFQPTALDTTTTKYGGLGIGCEISNYSVRQTNPVKQFELTIDGQAAGTIYYDLQKNSWVEGAGCYHEAAFLFNNHPVTLDASRMPPVAVLQTEL